jgi:hypothetical protein
MRSSKNTFKYVVTHITINYEFYKDTFYKIACELGPDMIIFLLSIDDYYVQHMFSMIDKRNEMKELYEELFQMITIDSIKIKLFLKLYSTRPQDLPSKALQDFITTAFNEYAISFPLIELFRWVQVTNKQLITKKQLRAFIHRFLTTETIDNKFEKPCIRLPRYPHMESDYVKWFKSCAFIDFFVELLITQYRHIKEEDVIQFIKNCAKSRNRVAGLREYRKILEQFSVYKTIEPIMIKISRDTFGNW